MKIQLSKLAVKNIEKMDKPTKQRVKKAIEKLPIGDIKKLQGTKNDYRLRIGDLRLIFSIDNDIIIIKAVLPRGEAYKK